jgi:hypothetical protein
MAADPSRSSWLRRRFHGDEAEIHVVDRDDDMSTSQACSSSPSG